MLPLSRSSARWSLAAVDLLLVDFLLVFVSISVCIVVVAQSVSSRIGKPKEQGSNKADNVASKVTLTKTWRSVPSDIFSRLWLETNTAGYACQLHCRCCKEW